MQSQLTAVGHTLVVGPQLAIIAHEAMPGAALQVAAADHMARAEDLHADLELILIDVDAAEGPVLSTLISSLGRRDSPPAVLLAGANIPVGLVKSLLRLPRSDVLEAPFTPLDLARAVGVLMASGPAAAKVVPPVQGSQCWSVTSSVGGCGATTLVVELATNLARRVGAQGRVALIDLNLNGGAACAYIGAAPNMLLAPASADPERIDASMLEVFAAKVAGGPDVFACPRDPRAFEKVAAKAVCKVLEIACQTYDYVIVDLPRQHQAWTLDVLAGSDEILVVSELTVPALISARHLAAEIEEDIPGHSPPRVILNRLASRVFGPAPSIGEAEKALQRKADGGITSDWEAAAACANLGGAIAHLRPRSKIVRDVDMLVSRLVSEGASLTRGKAA